MRVGKWGKDIKRNRQIDQTNETKQNKIMLSKILESGKCRKNIRP